MIQAFMQIGDYHSWLKGDLQVKGLTKRIEVESCSSKLMVQVSCKSNEVLPTGRDLNTRNYTFEGVWII